MLFDTQHVTVDQKLAKLAKFHGFMVLWFYDFIVWFWIGSNFLSETTIGLPCLSTCRLINVTIGKKLAKLVSKFYYFIFMFLLFGYGFGSSPDPE